MPRDSHHERKGASGIILTYRGVALADDDDDELAVIELCQGLTVVTGRASSREKIRVSRTFSEGFSEKGLESFKVR